MNLSQSEKKRLQNINFLMNEIHDSANQIYEHLVDREYKELKTEISSLNKKLRAVTDSIQDEI